MLRPAWAVVERPCFVGMRRRKRERKGEGDEGEENGKAKDSMAGLQRVKLPLFLLSTVLFLVGMTVIIVICSGVLCLRVFQRTSQRTGSRIHSDGQLGQHNYLAAPVPLPLR